MNCFQIMAVKVEQRDTAAVEVQKILTEYGCSIRTRLGLHDQADDKTCSPSGTYPPAGLRRRNCGRLNKKLMPFSGVKGKAGKPVLKNCFRQNISYFKTGVVF